MLITPDTYPTVDVSALRPGDQVLVYSRASTSTALLGTISAAPPPADGGFTIDAGTHFPASSFSRVCLVHHPITPLPTTPGTLVTRRFSLDGEDVNWLYARSTHGWVSLDAPSPHERTFAAMDSDNANGRVTVVFTPPAP